jgi:hypothetical protein
VSGAVTEGTHKGEVAGSNPAGCEAHDIHAKNAATCDFDEAGEGLPGLNFFCYFLGHDFRKMIYRGGSYLGTSIIYKS